MATLLITHDLALARDHCDRIVVMHAGHVVESAPTEELFSRPLHPYTARLIGATPGGRALDRRAGRDARQPARPAARRPAGLPLRRALRSAPRRGCPVERRCPSRARTAAHMRALPSTRWHAARVPSHDRRPARVDGPGQALPGEDAAGQGALLHAVDDVSFRSARARPSGLVGESGCGKSTLVRLITRMLDPTDGQILFLRRATSASSRALFPRTQSRREVQMVFQDPHRQPEPALHRLRHHRRTGAAARPACATRRSCAAQVEESPRAGRPAAGAAAALSAPALGRAESARRHRARDCAASRALLVLDEPTAALDVSVQAMILQLLADLQARARA